MMRRAPTSRCADGRGELRCRDGLEITKRDASRDPANEDSASGAGLYFQADKDLSPGIVWGDGLRCAGGNLKRLQVRFADATGVSSTTIGISAKAGNVMPGDTKYYQCWYRSTVNPPCGSGVNDFNTSNAYAVIWAP